MSPEPIRTYIVVLVGARGFVPDWTKFTGQQNQLADYVNARKMQIGFLNTDVLIKEEQAIVEFKPRQTRSLFETCYEEA